MNWRKTPGLRTFASPQFRLAVALVVSTAALTHYAGVLAVAFNNMNDFRASFLPPARQAWGGILLGAAITIKVTPALLVGYFLWKRDWKLCAVALGTAAALGLATLAVGWGGYWPNFLTTTGELGRGTASILSQSAPSVVL